MDDMAAASSYNSALIPAHSQKMAYATYDDTVGVRISYFVQHFKDYNFKNNHVKK